MIKLLFTLTLGLIFSSFFTSCENEPVVFTEVELIPEDSNLFLLLEQVTSDESEIGSVICINFVYNFTLFVYDEANEFVNREVMHNDRDFYQFLIAIPEEYSIGISFPIQSVLEDGTEFLVENKEQLENAIKDCLFVGQQAIIGNSNTIISECVWEVNLFNDDDPTTYKNAVFDVKDDGTFFFYNDGTSYVGTWIFFFIENELHLNINLTGDDEVTLDWNIDWKVDFVSNETIQISNDDITYVLKKECEEDQYCTSPYFKECELDDMPSFAEFVFENYKDCIAIFNNIEDQGDVEISFHLLFIDAEENINLLPENGYVNIESPQIIYVRITNLDTSDFIIYEITIQAETCF